MTTTGTTTFNLDLNDLVEEAFERAGSELRTGYDLRTARRSLNLLTIEWANRGTNLWTIEEGSINLVQGTATYNLPVNTIDLIDHVIRTGAGNVSTQSDLSITRIAVSTYATIPNKLQQGRPIQIYVDRQSGATTPTGINYPTATVWPIPDAAQQYQLIYWRLKRIDDAGNGGTYDQDIPFRFLPAMVAGLAYHMSVKIPGTDPNRVMALKADYEQQYELAAQEDRSRTPFRLVPNIGKVGRL